MVHTALTFTALMLMTMGSHAHVSLSPSAGKPGQVLDTAFHIPHGCNGSATTAISVTVPDSVISIQAKNVDGWNLALDYRQLNQSIQVNGQSVNQTVNTITWSGGNLANDKYQDFGIQVTLPQVDLSSQPNVTIYFPTKQTCTNGTSAWVGIPGTPSFDANKGHPAPQLVITNDVSSTTGHDAGHNSGQGRNIASGILIASSIFVATSLLFAL